MLSFVVTSHLMLPYHAMLLPQITSDSFVLGFFESSGEGGSSDGGQDDGGLGRNIRMSTIMGMLDRAAADIYGLQVEFERLDTGGCPSRQHQVRWMRSVFLGQGFGGCAFRVCHGYHEKALPYACACIL